MINETNCKNCGAPLHYDLESRIATCGYCSTEYHLDNLGRIEEYKVEIEAFGQRRTFYINSITQEYDHSCLYLDGCPYGNTVLTGGQLTMELVSYLD